ncbi:hypothetical protein FOZ60_008864 [Perkinsus olseni]|uniref:Peptidase A1 domain-containing protein n=1 Tax=Perkinsus olseni TaxID=32597 RepID=A0A7J6NJG5_PEROL|nr:hypothetical protein FOZ60_008864 [Perkinsus olseni]
MDTAYSFIPRYGYALTGGLSVDNQQIWAQIDTGASALLFTWKEWYDAVTHPGASSQLPNGAYGCPHCPVGPITPVIFSDGTTVHIFPHSGTFRIGGKNVDGIIFGLVSFQDPPPDVLTPVHSIGLGRAVTPGYHSLMDQLQGKVASTTFALYLKSVPNAVRTQGELLLGGGDPTLYKAPLTYIPLRSQQEYLVTLGTLQVGTGHKSIGINQPALIDTGTQGLVIPPDRDFDATLKAITDQASATAGFKVDCDYIPVLGACVIDCHHIVYLPPIELGLGPSGNAPVLISGLYYSRDTGGGFCTVATKRGQGSTWTLPHFILVGKYFEFQPSQQRVGIADFKL